MDRLPFSPPSAIFATPTDPSGTVAAGMLERLRQAGTPWPGPQSAPATPAGREVRREKLHSGPQGVQIPWFLPYFDPNQTLDETHQMRLAYRRMLADPNVKAALYGKVLAVGSLDLRVLPADKKDPRDKEIAEFARWNFQESLAGGTSGLAWSILSGGCIDGYSVCERVWDHETRGQYRGKYFYRAIKPKDVGNDLVLLTDSHRNVVSIKGLRYNPGIEFSPSDFVIFRHLPLYDTATGQSDFRAAYSRYWMLDTVLKLRAIGLEKRSLPVLLGEYTDPAQRPSLEEQLAQVRSQNWLAVPEGVRVTALNIAGSADATFAEAVKDLKHDIFLAIQGAILQSLEGSVTDGRGSSQVHRTTADLFIWYLARSLEDLLNDRRNGLIRDLVDLNYVTDRYPRASLSAVDVGEQQKDLEIDRGLWAMGVELSKDEVREKYGRRPPEDEEDILSGEQKQKGNPGDFGPPGAGLPPEEPPPSPPSSPGSDQEFAADDQVSLFTRGAMTFSEGVRLGAEVSNRPPVATFEEWQAFHQDAQARKPGEVWKGPSGRFFMKKSDGHVVPAADPGKQGGGGSSQPAPTPVPQTVTPPADATAPAPAREDDPAANRPSRPEERKNVKPPSLPKKKPPAPTGQSRAPKNEQGRPVTGYAANGIANTYFGDMVESLMGQLNLRNILPEGKRSHGAGQVTELGSSLDREYDHSGYAMEVKAVCVEGTEYKCKLKKSEADDKRRFAEMHQLTPATMIVVTDTEKGEAHAYWREGIGAFAVNPENLEDWNYAGSVQMPADAVARAKTQASIERRKAALTRGGAPSA